MFDYQAGEKYRLTLIMVGVAGIMAGMFFTMLLMPTPQPTRRRVQPGYMSHPDITGQAQMPGSTERSVSAPAPAPTQAPVNPNAVSPAEAQSLIDSWLPYAWDLSAGTAKASQEKAMSYMTEQAKAAYKQNIWTDEIAKQIEEAGVQSTFKPHEIKVGSMQPDGSIVVFVTGEQVLSVPQKGSTSRMVSLEYLIRKVGGQLRIAGISEGSKNST